VRTHIMYKNQGRSYLSISSNKTMLYTYSISTRQYRSLLYNMSYNTTVLKYRRRYEYSFQHTNSYDRTSESRTIDSARSPCTFTLEPWRQKCLRHDARDTTSFCLFSSYDFSVWYFVLIQKVRALSTKYRWSTKTTLGFAKDLKHF
jgi:hypothetical protein